MCALELWHAPIVTLHPESRHAPIVTARAPLRSHCAIEITARACLGDSCALEIATRAFEGTALERTARADHVESPACIDCYATP